MSDDVRYYTIKQLCDLTGLRPRYFQNAIRDHKLSAVKAGQKWLVKSSDYEQFMESLPRSSAKE